MEQQRLERLLGIGRSMVSELDLDALLEHILEVARELTGARYAAIGVLDERRENLARFLTSGIDAETREVIGDLPRGRGVLGALISDPRPLRLQDVGEHPQSYGFPVGHPPMRSFLGVPILVRGRAWGNVYLTEKDSGLFTDDDEETISVLADWAAVAITNAGTYREETARRRELERGVAAYEATLEIAKALAGETDLDIVLELVVKRGRALVHASSMLIGLVEGDDLVVATTAGVLHRDLVGTRIPRDGSIAGQVVRLRRSQRLSNLPSGLTASLRELVDARAGLFVPLLLRGRSIGVLEAFDRLEDGPAFDAEDERLMEAFATSAANAVATAQNVAAEGMQRAMHAAEEERRRWARELHDDTLQEIGSLRVLLGAARQTGDRHETAKAVDHAIDRLAAQADVLRALITDLHPAALDRLGVQPAIEALADRLRRRADVDVSVAIDLAYEGGRKADRLAPATEVAAYRLVQEAVTNAVRHADPQHVRIELQETDGELRIRVQDDGRGFDPAAVAAGFGLMGMRERVALLSGELDIRSRADEGAVVEATLPAVHTGEARASGQRTL